MVICHEPSKFERYQIIEQNVTTKAMSGLRQRSLCLDVFLVLIVTGAFKHGDSSGQGIMFIIQFSD
jgi:hypothetical protein